MARDAKIPARASKLKAKREEKFWHEFSLFTKSFKGRKILIRLVLRSIQQAIYKKYIQKIIPANFNNKMDLNSSHGDVSYNSSDESQGGFRQPQMNLASDLQEINETADSFRQIFNNQTEDDSYHEASQVFSKYYHKNLLRIEIPEEQKFQKHILFKRYEKNIRAYPPKPNLYFLPTILMFDRRIDRILDLRDSIVKSYGARANVQIPKQRPQQILATIHKQKSIESYIIRSVNLSKNYRHSKPQLLDQDLSLNPLFQFYEENYKDHGFSETCGIFLYWAYQKKLLNSDYLSPTAMKIIVIFFYIVTEGVPNVVSNFMQKKSSELNKITKMITVNKRLQCELDPQLFNYVNFSLRQKKSFFIQNQNKYSTMVQILPVWYPVSKEDTQQYSKKCKDNLQLQQRSKEIYPMVKFFKIMEYLQNSIKRSQRVIFDFVSSKKGMQVKPQIDFNIEIKHPIFGNNLCEKLTNDGSKLRILKQEINRVVTIYKRDKREPLTAISKVFERS